MNTENNKRDYEANRWLIKQNEGLSKEEKIQLNTWLLDEENKKVYEEYKLLIDECLELDDDFIKKLENENLEHKHVNHIFYKNRYIIACIATITTVFFASFEIYNYFQPIFLQEYISKNEKVLHIILPDNSSIDMDVKSHVKVVYYRNKRVIELAKGVALFDVTKDKAKPFIVKAGKTLINVLGTKFEVANLGKKTLVNVVRGLVKVDYIYDEKNNQSTFLKYLQNSQTLTLSHMGKVVNHGKVEVNRIASWTKDIIEFDKTTLQEAFNLFERYSSQKVKFQTKELSLLKISGKFSTLHYDSFLESIELIYPVKILRQANSIEIVNK